MLWYLLYPFRGTTEPPILGPKHPLRYFFTRWGTYSARHPVITLLISVAVAVFLTYPFPFLYTNNFTNGSSNLPHHVWTSAQPYEGRSDTRADVVMRSIWVHGSYMKALQPNVLQNALEIQDELLGPTINFDPRRPSAGVELDNAFDLTTDMRDSFHAINGLSNSSWFFHSPLQYWSCSSETIANDKDLITTINQSSRQSTSVNVTLRHSIVFSGKRFEDHRLVAADALVITLVHMLDSPVGRQWERKAEEMALKKSGKWRMYPADGRSLSSTLYEFRFQPLSFFDDLFLGIAYTLCTIFFLIRLTKLRALRSRLGLIIAIMAHIAVSIMSSFTICAVLKIDLSKMPRQTYPLVIVTCGLENIFRLINAVIMTRSEDSISARLGEALGKTGHIALAGVGEKLFLLWLLAKTTYPPITAFCTFAAVSFIFDYFYMLTFFTAVLSIDVQRLELSDALNKSVAKNGHVHQAEEPLARRSWTDAVLSGDAPFSTRIAGTVVMVGFVLVAQWHFFEDESLFQTSFRLFNLFKSTPKVPRSTSASLLTVDIHQARSPTAWLKLQDHETAHEVIKVVKPNANSYIARVYDPLIFVLDASDRTPNKLGVRPFLPAAYDFVKHQCGLFIIIFLLILAAVSLLMNYLLWNEIPDSEDNSRPEDEPLISIKTLSRGHTLDIVLIAASNEGVLATVGLDRWIRIWDVRKGIMSYIVHDPEKAINPFPVLAVAIDEDSNWLGILSAQDKVFMWNIPEQRWGPTVDVVVKGRTPASFFFGFETGVLINTIYVVHHNGVISELNAEIGQSKDIQTCLSFPVVYACKQLERHWQTTEPESLHILITSRDGSAHIASNQELTNEWSTSQIYNSSIHCTKARFIFPLPALSAFLVARESSVDLIDIVSHNIIHTFSVDPMKTNSLRCFHSTRRKSHCGSIALSNFALAYTASNGKCILQTYVPSTEGQTICFRDPDSKTCCSWNDTVETRHEIDNPGEWEALPAGYLVGVRKKELSSSYAPNSYGSPSPSPIANSSLRRRGLGLSHSNPPPRQMNHPDTDTWEIWALSSRGERYTLPLCTPSETASSQHLLISSLGPLQRMGRRSIVVGLGNVVKLVTVGNEKWDNVDDGAELDGVVLRGSVRAGLLGGAGGRKRRGGRGNVAVAAAGRKGL